MWGKKTRCGSHEMFEFLEKKCQRDHQMKQEKINLKREEQEVMTAVMEQQQQPLQNFRLFLNHQTQQPQAMLAILEKVDKK